METVWKGGVVGAPYKKEGDDDGPQIVKQGNLDGASPDRGGK